MKKVRGEGVNITFVLPGGLKKSEINEGNPGRNNFGYRIYEFRDKYRLCVFFG